MPFLLSHSFAGTAVASIPFRDPVPKRLWSVAALCAAIPDFDTAWSLQLRGSASWFAHRGITHTPVFAAVLATAFVWWAFPSHTGVRRARLWIALFVATASHGVLDALSGYGPGIPFLFPLSDQRYFFPWRPIQAGSGPRGLGIISRLLRSIGTELLWIWLPGTILLAITALRRRSHAPRAAA